MKHYNISRLEKAAVVTAERASSAQQALKQAWERRHCEPGEDNFGRIETGRPYIVTWINAEGGSRGLALRVVRDEPTPPLVHVEAVTEL